MSHTFNDIMEFKDFTRESLNRGDYTQEIEDIKVGINTNVSKVLTANPPIIVTAKGTPISPTYSDLPNAKGINAIIVVIAVIRIGRTRASPAIINARESEYPRRRKTLE